MYTGGTFSGRTLSSPVLLEFTEKPMTHSQLDVVALEIRQEVNSELDDVVKAGEGFNMALEIKSFGSNCASSSASTKM
jgi:hypothetical protein